MVNIPWLLSKIHIVVAYGSVHCWPFTRLVHALTVPCTTSSPHTVCAAPVAVSVWAHVEAGIRWVLSRVSVPDR